MNKLIYCLGVYHLCIMIHDLPDVVHSCADEINKAKKKRRLEQNGEKGAIGIQPRPAHKPLDRIGF